MIGIKVKGVVPVLKRLNILTDSVVDVYARAAGEQWGLVYAETQKMAPRAKDTKTRKGGTLRKSGILLDRSSGRGRFMRIQFEILYRAPYAIFVHEINKNYHNGSWKYIEVPVKRAKRTMAANIAARVKRLLG